MDKKYIFFDLDGTLIDHSENKVREKTLLLIKELKKNGHELFIATGRPPSLFYGIDKELGIESYIAANGCIAVYKDDIILNRPIPKQMVKKVVDYAVENSIDVGFESKDDYVVHTKITDLVDKFSDIFHLEYPDVVKDYHLSNDVYQMVFFYTKDDYKRYEEMFPGLWFNFSCEYGLDINLEGGLKDLGVKAMKDYLDIDIKDIICVGDGFNDVTMIEYAGLGIAMGNAKEEVKNRADMVAGHISDDGLYNIFKDLKLI